MADSDYYSFNKQFAVDGPYDTSLSKDEEKAYRAWLTYFNHATGRRLSPDDKSYDMRGFWKEHVNSATSFIANTLQHFPDVYKTPYHPTFSRESRYATKDAPYWENDVLVNPSTGTATQGFMDEVLRER